MGQNTPGKALHCGVDIVEALLGGNQRHSFSELKENVEVSRSSFARYLNVLLERGYVQKDAEGYYIPGPRLIRIGARSLESAPLHREAEPYLQALVEKTQETAECAVFDRDSFMFTNRVESPQSVTLRAHIGSVHAKNDVTAIGLLGLAYDPRFRNDPAYEQIRDAGYATLLQNNNDIFRAASAVFNGSQTPVGALILAAPAYRVDKHKESQFINELIEHTRSLSQDLST